jgi:NAD(P)-dependent dehydrogenase (short-subunit alcohol dehydrogenase family)
MSVPRIVVLTGVTRGLGRAMLAELVAAGHAVAGCGRDAAHIEALRRKYPAPHRFATVDVSDDGQVAEWAARLLATVGPPDLLINNAAVVNANAQLWEISAGEFDALTAVNINGVANVIRHFVPAMVKVKRGVIVNFSSGWGRSTSPGVAPYCATKWAIEGLTKALAQELPEGMAAVPLNPGIIDTDMLRISFGNAADAYESPERWAVRAVRKILALGTRDSGRSLSVD